jgi:carbonic anhydrase
MQARGRLTDHSGRGVDRRARVAPPWPVEGDPVITPLRSSRRSFLRMAGVLTTVAALGACTPVTIEIVVAPTVPAVPATGDEALAKLMAGNQRYVSNGLAHPNQSADRRGEVAKGQKPFAVILGCADSRVGPEIVFDQGLGDLFVVRVAGNVLDSSALGSIEYAAEHLHTPLIMVLGHQKCGAVEAALKGGEAPGQIGSLVKAIQPAVAHAKGQPGDALDNAVKANVEMVVAQLKTAKPIVTDLLEHGKVKVVGARYRLDTGAVELLGASPAKAASPTTASHK